MPRTLRRWWYLAPPSILAVIAMPASAAAAKNDATGRTQCAPRAQEKVAATAPRATMLLRTDVQQETIFRRLQFCSPATGLRRTLDRTQEDPSGGTGNLTRFKIRGRVTAWTRIEGNPVRSTLVVARAGRRIKTFAAPGAQTPNVPDSTSIRQVAITSRGLVAFVSSTTSTGDVLRVIGPDGIPRRLDAATPATIKDTRWTAPNTVRWQNGTAARSTRLSAARDPCIATVKRVADATLEALVGANGDTYVGCLRNRGAPVTLPGRPFNTHDNGSVGLAGPFVAVRAQPASPADYGTAIVVDLRTGQPATPPHPLPTERPRVTLNETGHLTFVP